MSETKEKEEWIEVYGAREHNLKNIDVKIPRNQLVVITGVSGSGKSSLAFDTIYAEGQRRYMESFSAYARSFIGDMERPDVDKIEGLSPVISIEQKTTNKNPRSTVGTLTEIYDFLRLLYARTADAFSYETGEKMVKMTEDQIIDLLLEQHDGQAISILAPVVKGRKGHYRELFVQVQKQGFTKVRVDGEVLDLVPKMQIDRYKTHDIEIVIDRLVIEESDRFRITQSVKSGLKHGDGIISIQNSSGEISHFSRNLMCPTSGIAYDEPAPNNFSFNSPYGACPSCNGLGEIQKFTEKSILIDKELSIYQGAIGPLGDYKRTWVFQEIEKILKSKKLEITTPIKNIKEDLLNDLLHGGTFQIDTKSNVGTKMSYELEFDGVFHYLEKLHSNEPHNKLLLEHLEKMECPSCNGLRLKKESLHFKIDNKNISELAMLDIHSLWDWFNNLESRISKRQATIGTEVIKEIRKRINFLLDVGLDYLSLNRTLRSLSGGEAQRIRLATQIGTQLVGVSYILDEPSIGLHQRDNVKLIEALKNLRDIGNTVLVVEHDLDMMLESDYVLDIGPGAGRHGGKVVASGKPKDIINGENSTTSQYLSGAMKIEIPKTRREGNGDTLELIKATGHNLKNVTLKLPLGKMICVTGVSGSGKSSLIHDTLHPILSQHFYRSRRDPLAYKELKGLDHIDKVIEVDQSPIGRTPRSNPATYTGLFSDIRSLFTQLPEAKIRGYKPGRFSFNVKGGRCEECEGGGIKIVEMDFLPSVHVHCEGCKGKRYNRETLEIRFKGKSISDVLDMTVDDAVNFFEKQPKISRKVKTLQDVGLGYITLGQHATTLSGGEAQRVKLATELSKKDTGKTLYILDEPTTGLHFQDIQHLLTVLNQLVDKGNTVLIIEHNLDVIKVADHIIDIGPEGGSLGGNIVCEGTPEKVVKNKKSYTAKFLLEELKR